MTLDCYFKKKIVIPNPNRDLSLTIQAIVIASINPEVEFQVSREASTRNNAY